MADEGRRIRSRKYILGSLLSNTRAVDQCENLELNPSKEWEPMKMVKHECRDARLPVSQAPLV